MILTLIPTRIPAAPWLQRTVVALRDSLFPRGWAPLLRICSTFAPALRCYEAKLLDGDRLFLDLRESMCMGYFFHGELAHERGTKEILGLVLSDGAAFVDVGANVGYYTRMAARIVGPNGKVLAFEPLPTAYQLLQRNSADLVNVLALQSALGDRSGTVPFYVHPSGDQSSTMNMGDAQEQIRVEIKTLDSMTGQFDRVDFIKIDVEGSELQVLQGGKETIERFEPVIQFEFLPKYQDAYDLRFADFQDFFRTFSKAHYEVFRVSREIHGELLAPVTAEGSDMLAVPRRRKSLLVGLRAAGGTHCQ